MSKEVQSLHLSSYCKICVNRKHGKFWTQNSIAQFCFCCMYLSRIEVIPSTLQLCCSLTRSGARVR